MAKVHISIHAPREGSDLTVTFAAQSDEISIHAPREGSDRYLLDMTYCIQRISIHAPREGSDAHGG